MTAVTTGSSPVEAIEPALRAALQEASSASRPVLACLMVRIERFDPIAAFEAVLGQERALWWQPEAGFALVASGVADRYRDTGEGRFDRALAWWRDLTARTAVIGARSGPVPPLCLGGFAFDPAARRPGGPWNAFADADLVLPEALLVRDGDAARAILTARMLPADDPAQTARRLGHALGRLLTPAAASRGDHVDATLREHDDGAVWREAVREATRAIRRGAMLKVVLARELKARGSEPFEISLALRRLEVAYPGCTLFAFERDGACFLGATPERLVRLDGTRVRTACLAGSRPRGAAPAEDAALGRELFADRKERFEHALVVQSIRDALEPVCVDLGMPGEPALLRVANVQHLHTPVEGTTRADVTALELVARLHPTPAVGGVPREAALDFIRTREHFDRGWYAGPVGWMAADGSGEFVVGLRSALVRGEEARLFAGCGVVADSDAGREYEESCLKLRPMRWALGLP